MEKTFLMTEQEYQDTIKEFQLLVSWPFFFLPADVSGDLCNGRPEHHSYYMRSGCILFPSLEKDCGSLRTALS